MAKRKSEKSQNAINVLVNNMKENYFQTKLLISMGAWGIIIARVILPNLKIDAITLGLLVVAVLPWFSDLLQSAKLPGGWEVNFRDIEKQQNIIQENQHIQGKQIDKLEKQIKRLTLLMNSCLSQNQLELNA